MSDPPLRINILLVEDDAGDVLLTKRAIDRSEFNSTLNVVGDGIEALEYLQVQSRTDSNCPRPDLILLDLNMPRMDGRELLKRLKSDDNLKRIPVIILTTSDAQSDINQMYDLHANCYMTKPDGMEQYNRMIRSIHEFWMANAKLPA